MSAFNKEWSENLTIDFCPSFICPTTCHLVRDMKFNKLLWKMEQVLQKLLYLVTFIKWTAILVFILFFGLITKQVSQI